MFDIVGVSILIAVIAVFVFLITRVRKLKNAILKWGGTLITGLLTLLSTTLLVLALIGFYKLNERYDNPVTNVRVAGTPAQLARGERLAHLCMSCHSPNNQLPLSGANFLQKFGGPPLGTVYAPNLTPSGNIADWSNGEVIRAIREGVHKNGRSLLVMPADMYRKLSDDDVQALVAYLRSQPAIGGPTPDNQFSVIGAVFINLVDFRTAQLPVGNLTTPQPGTPEYGKYMVDITECRGCHGSKLQGKVYSGVGPPTGPNLTQIVPNWTEAQFMALFNTGQLPGGGTVPTLTLPSGFTSPTMPWSMLRAAVTDDELKDIYTYLHSLPPVEGPEK